MAQELMKPTNLYTVFGNPIIDHSKEQSLLFLYQPIIGGLALSLYLSLIADLEADGKSQPIMHADLLAAIDHGLPDFLTARERLEAIGLIRTFQKEDAELGTQFYYELKEPLAPADFFKENLLTYLLTEKVGEGRFKRLVDRFKPNQFDKAGLMETTKRFRDVYRLNEQRFAANSEQLEQTQQAFTKDDVQLTDADFDWHFFKQQLLRFKIEITPADQEKLATLHTLYGLDALELAELVAKSADSNNQIQYDYLRQLIQKDTAPKQELLTEGKAESKAIEQDDPRAKLEAEGFAKPEIEIILQSKEIPPIEYLQAIKQQKHGFATQTEMRLIESLISRQILPKAVVNILINYVLVIQNNANLNSNFVNAIANDWAQRKITQPEKAILHVRQSNQKVPRKKNSAATYTPRGRSGNRVEKLPKYIKEPPKEKQLSAEKQSELDKKLQAYLNKEGDK